MKVYKIGADTKEAVKNLKDLEIQSIKVISAQEVLQGILTSPAPLKNIEKIIPAYKKIGDITESISKMTPASVKQLQEAQVIVNKGIDKQLEGAKKISDAHKKQLNEINKERQALKEKEKEHKESVEKMQQTLLVDRKLGKEISEEQKKWVEDLKAKQEELSNAFELNSKKRKEVMKEAFDSIQKNSNDAYAQTIYNIKLKYDLEEQEIRNSCDLTLVAENEKMGIKRASAENEEAMMIAQHIKLKDLEERKNKELQNAEQEHQKSNASMIENFLKERTSKLEVYVDNTTKTTEKSTKKIQKELGDFLNGVDDDVIKSILKQSTQAQNAATATADATKKEADANKENAAATKEAADATKKYLDIKATRNNYQTEINELKDLQAERKEALNLQIAWFEAELYFAGDNAEKRKEIDARKTAYVKQYATEIIQIQQAVTATEEKEQALSLKQWEQYAQKAEEITNSIKGVTGKVADYFSTAFTAVSNVYKAEIEGINEDIKQLSVKKEENAKEEAANTTAKNQLKSELAQAEKDGNQEAIQNINERIAAEETLTTEITTQKTKLADEEAKLNLKKAKAQKEQEKIEKLNRKATLLKNIGEATANVAQGVTKTMGAYPWPLNLALATLVGAAGAVQIGIMTKQLAKFADGGLLNGKRHAQGGMRIEGSNIEVEGGEYVVNRESTTKNLGLVRYINSERRELKPADINSFFARSSQGFEPSYRRMFEDGGQLPAIETANNIDNESLIQAIRSIRIEPRVAVTDIHRVQDSMISVDGWTGV